MSEESNPPPLRLKPRLRPETAESSAETPAAPATPAPAETTPVESTETPRLRLKPRLNQEPAAEPEKAAGPESAATEEKPAPTEPEAETAAPRLRLKPKLTSEPANESEPKPEPEKPVAENPPTPAPPPVEEKPVPDAAPKFKLKPKTAATEAPPSVAAVSPPPSPPPVAPPKAVEAPPPTPPAVAPPAEDEPQPPPLVVDPPPKPSGVKPPAPLKKRRPPRKPPLVLLLVLLVLVLGGGGYAVWALYLDVPEPEPIAVRRPAATPPAPPAEPAPANVVQGAEPQSTAGQMIAQARDAAIAHKENIKELSDQVMASEPPTPAEPPPGEINVAALAQSQISKGITATTTTMLATVEASPAFQSFVAEMRINGVFQGSPARALINGRTYNEGEIVEPNLGVSFAGVEPDEKLIVFRDATGAIVKRKY